MVFLYLIIKTDNRLSLQLEHSHLRSRTYSHSWNFLQTSLLLVNFAWLSLIFIFIFSKESAPFRRPDALVLGNLSVLFHFSGDVDSGEDETEIYGHLQKIPLPVPSVHHLHIPNQSRASETPLLPAANGSYSSPRKPEHETKL